MVSAPTWSPLLVGTLGTVAGGWVWSARRARPRAGDPGAAVATAAGLVVLAVAFAPPVATMAQHNLLTVHLVQVTLVMGFAPPLLLLGLPRPRRASKVAPGLGTVARLAAHPAVAIVLVNAVFFGWHAPVLYDACLAAPWLYDVQMLSLLLVSLAFWWPIVDPLQTSRLGPLMKLGYILLATIPQTFAGMVFALAHHVFYRGYDTTAVGGMSALTDQQVAGACMALLSKLALFVAFSVLMWRLLAPHASDTEPGDDDPPGGDRRDPVSLPPPTPAWLRTLQDGPLRDEPAPSRDRPRREPAAPVR